MKLQFKLSHARTVLVLLLAVLGYYGAWAEELGGYNFDTEGTGTDKVYLIKTETDLENLAAYVNAGNNCEGLTFKLYDDITMTAVAAGQSNHTPIGNYQNSSNTFCGTFDGNEKTITGLVVYHPNNDKQGLFGKVGNKGVIKKLTLADCHITGSNQIGGIAGMLSGYEPDIVTVQDCHVSGFIQATVTNTSDHGGIAGFCSGAVITRCTMQGTISIAETTANYAATGGILGSVSESNVSLCENAANITGHGLYVGGIVGECMSYGSIDINHCLNTGTIEGVHPAAIVAMNWNHPEHISNCYYAPPCNVNGFGTYDQGGRTELVYTITAGSHIASIVDAEDPSFTSMLTATKYYASGDRTVTLTPDLDNETFITYACEGGTLDNLTTAGGTHTLTIGDQDVTIVALVSSNSGIDIGGATIDDIPEQRWKVNAPVEPTVTVTYGTETLTLGTDYLVEYTNNYDISQGIATVIVKGINNYRLTTSKTFDIADFPLENPQAANSATNPYLVADENDLEALACLVNTHTRNGGYYKQTGPITMTKEHTPIGSYDGTTCEWFIGTYDGNYYTIRGLYINKPTTYYVGLFGQVMNQCCIKNIRVVDCDITGLDYTGGIVGNLGNASMYDCGVSGSIKQPLGGTTIGYIGGIAGRMSSGTMQNCFSDATVTGRSLVGSVIGCLEGYPTISNNYHTATTTGAVGSFNATVGTDQAGFEVVTKISAGNGVTITYPATPTYVWNNENYYKDGTEITLSYALPSGKYFDRYTVTGAEMSNSLFMTGVHTLTAFTDLVTISGSYVDSQTDLADGQGAIANVPCLIFNGQTQEPLPVVTYGDETLVKDANYIVTCSEACTDAGTYNVTVTGTGRYKGSLTSEFNIQPLNIGGDDVISVSGIASYYKQTGSAIHPIPTAVTCAAANNATLVPGEDYVLSYSDGCTELGDYEVFLTGTGNYSGTKTVPFTIHDSYLLTVHDDTETHDAVPVYGEFTEYYQKSEFVMPAAELAAMDKKAITKMQFYLQKKANGPWNGTFQVFMKEVNFTNFTSPNNHYSGTTGATIVYEGGLDGREDLMTINFTTPYIYHGGNLLIGFYKTTHWDNNINYTAEFYGEQVSQSCIYGYDYNKFANVREYVRNFLPKTTFWYDEPSAKLTMNAAGIMTYASAYDLDFTDVDGLTAYTATAINNNTLTLTAVNKAPAGTGLLLKGTANTNFTVPAADDATAITSNYLVGVLNGETVVQQAETIETVDYTNFILANGSYGIDWYTLSESGAIGANKAYLRLPTSALSNGARLTMEFGDATGVDEMRNENGEMRNGAWYTVNGVRLSGKPTRKGLYLFNGKKTVVK